MEYLKLLLNNNEFKEKEMGALKDDCFNSLIKLKKLEIIKWFITFLINNSIYLYIYIIIKIYKYYYENILKYFPISEY